jgi:hypothetical protein
MQAIEEGHELRPGPASPGPVGLLIRVVLGAASVWGLVDLVTKVSGPSSSSWPAPRPSGRLATYFPRK